MFSSLNPPLAPLGSLLSLVTLATLATTLATALTILCTPLLQCRFVDTPLYVSQNKFDSNQAGSIFGVSWWPLPLNKAKHAASQVAYKQYVKETRGNVVRGGDNV